MTIGDTGNLEIAGTVNAGNVKELDSWITTNRNTVSGLYPLVDQNKLSGIEEGAEKNYIREVNTKHFTVSEAGVLNLSQDYVTTSLYQAEIGDLNKLLTEDKESTTIVDEIISINERLQWQEIEN